MESKYYYEPFTAYIAGFIVPLVTGTLSAFSSALIIYIILRSQQKLSTTYHRIMALMSAFDIISSSFIALGTIMVPSDTIYEFAGPLLGTQATCKVQGWLIMFGLTGANALNACLSWYFVCRLVFRVNIHKMTRYVEPFMFIYTAIVAFLIPSFYLSADLIHPNAYDSFCTMAPYPKSCDQDFWYDWSCCTWEDGVLDKYYTYAIAVYIGIVVHFVLIVVGMSIILWGVNKNKHEIIALQLHENSLTPHEQREVPSLNIELHYEDGIKREHTLNDLQHSRVLIFQALMYIGAFFLTWVLNVLSGGFNITNIVMDGISSVLFPLQGFWNLLIFLYDKSYSIRNESDNGITFCQSIKHIMVAPEQISMVFVTNMSEIVGGVAEEQTETNQNVDEQPALDAVYEEISEIRAEVSRSVIHSSSGSSLKLFSSRVNVSLPDNTSAEDHKRMELSNTRSRFIKYKKERVNHTSNQIHGTNRSSEHGHEALDDEKRHATDD